MDFPSLDSAWVALLLFSHGSHTSSERKSITQGNYKHGQKSWDNFTFVALFTRAKQTVTLVQPLPPPSPPPPYNVGHVITLFLQGFNIVLGGGGNAFWNG